MMNQTQNSRQSNSLYAHRHTHTQLNPENKENILTFRQREREQISSKIEQKRAKLIARGSKNPLKATGCHPNRHQYKKRSKNRRRQTRKFGHFWREDRTKTPAHRHKKHHGCIFKTVDTTNNLDLTISLFSSSFDYSRDEVTKEMTTKRSYAELISYVKKSLSDSDLRKKNTLKITKLGKTNEISFRRIEDPMKLSSVDMKLSGSSEANEQQQSGPSFPDSAKHEKKTPLGFKYSNRIEAVFDSLMDVIQVGDSKHLDIKNFDSIFGVSFDKESLKASMNDLKQEMIIQHEKELLRNPQAIAERFDRPEWVRQTVDAIMKEMVCFYQKKRKRVAKMIKKEKKRQTLTERRDRKVKEAEEAAHSGPEEVCYETKPYSTRGPGLMTSRLSRLSTTRRRRGMDLEEVGGGCGGVLMAMTLRRGERRRRGRGMRGSSYLGRVDMSLSQIEAEQRYNEDLLIEGHGLLKMCKNVKKLLNTISY